jgi:hypothetical protein
MKDRDKFISLAVIGTFVASSCNLLGRSPSPTEHPLATPTILSPTPTPLHEITPTPTRTPGPATIINGLTGAIYQVVPNPEGKPGKCVKLGNYSESNKQDVFGAATALGPNPNAYRDYPKFKVFKPDHTVMGSFSTETVEAANPYWYVDPGTIVCED